MPDTAITLRVVGKRLQVHSPFNKAFRGWAIEHGGRWRYKSGFWSFRLSQRAAVEAALRRYFEYQG